jgi:DNA-binding NtrC family response regulator
MHKILVVDDDPFFLELVNASLKDYQVITATDADHALQIYREHRPVLVSLDIKLQDCEGYTICQKIREEDEHTPILFMSARNDLDSRLRAYGEGGSDYISKPYQKQELIYKVEKLIDRHVHQQSLNDQLQDSSSLITNIQREAAHLQTVNRFIQSSMHCKDVDTLLSIFFIALRDLDSSGVLILNSTPETPYECGSPATRLEREILNMGYRLPRIHSFGQNRALFNWQRCTLLVRELNSLVDVLAILMDALDMVLASIETEHRLVEQIAQLETANGECQEQVESLITDMSLSLQDNMVTLGLVSDLDESEERMINDTIHSYCQQIQEKLSLQNQQGHKVRQLIDQLRQPSEEIQRLLEHAQTSSSPAAAIELF